MERLKGEGVEHLSFLYSMKSEIKYPAPAYKSIKKEILHILFPFQH